MNNIVSKSRDYLKAGIPALAKKVFNKVCHTQFFCYQSYLAANEKGKQQALAGTAEHLPLISVVVPVYRTKPSYFKALLSSVTASEYEKWELCLADGSENSDDSQKIKRMVREQNDERIRYCCLSKNLGIAGNTNAAIRMAKGDWIVFMDHDDTITVDALGAIAAAAVKNPEAELIYSDEDKIRSFGGPGYDPHFKPEFDNVLLDSVNYISHLTAMKRELVRRIGGLDSAYDGAQDYDFILRASENAAGIIHIPKVLYHWRSCPGSTARNLDQKGYAGDAGKKALAAHLKRVYGDGIEVNDGFSAGNYRLRFPVPGCTLTVLLWTKGNPLGLSKKVQSVREKLGEDFIVKAAAFDELISAAREADSDYVLFLAEDAVITKDAVNTLLGFLASGYVDACGCTLVDKGGRIICSGQIRGENGYPFDAFYGIPATDSGYMGRAAMMRRVTYLPIHCLMMPKKLVPNFKRNSTPELLGAKLCRYLGHLQKKIACASFIQVELCETKGPLSSTCLRYRDKNRYGTDRFYHRAFIRKSPGFLVSPGVSRKSKL